MLLVKLERLSFSFQKKYKDKNNDQKTAGAIIDEFGVSNSDEVNDIYESLAKL